MNHSKYSYLMNLNQNIINYCKYESSNFNTECWIVKKNSFSSLNTTYIFKTNNKIKVIKITNIDDKKDLIKFFENDIFLVYLRIKKKKWKL